MALEINAENFDELVINSDVPVLMDFWAPWCGPCRMLGPIIDSLNEENKDKNIKIVKINVDDNQEIALKFGVRGIPLTLAIKDGKEVEGSRNAGIQAKAEYQKLIDSLL